MIEVTTGDNANLSEEHFNGSFREIGVNAIDRCSRRLKPVATSVGDLVATRVFKHGNCLRSSIARTDCHRELKPIH